MDTFDVVVVGGGLIGGAAARHLAEAGHRTALVAAPEPTDWSSASGPFASHYDAGRVTRIIDRSPVWAELASRSIGRYADIEERSGISLHDARGVAWMGIDIDQAVQNGVDRGADSRLVDPDWLYATTGIRAPETPGLQVAFEGAPAGVVNPRMLAHAQRRLTELAGGTVIMSAAEGIVPDRAGVIVSGAFGEIHARRVLLATGAWAADLVGAELLVERWLRTTLRIDMGPKPELPSLILSPVEHPHINDLYWNPPVRYPDGRLLFKIGCEIIDPPLAHDAAEIEEWFRGLGDPIEADALMDMTKRLLPDAEIGTSDTVPCVITRTPTRLPYVGWIDEQVAVAVGGSGAAAKSSDEIGRLASRLFSEAGWTDVDLDAELFSPQFRR